MVRVILILSLIVIFVSYSFSETVGITGKVYPIEEKDAYEEILQRAQKIKWSMIERKFKETVKDNLVVNYNLRKAKDDRIFYVDPTYTLPVDMVDAEGRIIYPKGFTFNPLDYVVFREKLVFINGNSVDEINWLKKQPLLYDYNTLVIVTSGDVFKVSSLLNKVAYRANDRIIERFKIQSTPTIVEAEKRYFVAKEVGIYGKQNKENKK